MLLKEVFRVRSINGLSGYIFFMQIILMLKEHQFFYSCLNPSGIGKPVQSQEGDTRDNSVGNLV